MDSKNKSQNGDAKKASENGASGDGVDGAIDAAFESLGTGGIQQPEELLNALAATPLFSGLPIGHLRRIVEIGTQTELTYRKTIFAEGDPGDRFYVVLSGAVRISRMVPGIGEEALTVLRQGAYFGEMALIDDFPRSAHAIVHEACRLFSITKRDLEDLMFVDRDLAYEILWNFVRTMSARLRQTNDKMTFLATSSRFS